MIIYKVTYREAKNRDSDFSDQLTHYKNKEEHNSKPLYSNILKENILKEEMRKKGIIFNIKKNIDVLNDKSVQSDTIVIDIIKIF